MRGGCAREDVLGMVRMLMAEQDFIVWLGFSKQTLGTDGMTLLGIGMFIKLGGKMPYCRVAVKCSLRYRRSRSFLEMPGLADSI